MLSLKSSQLYIHAFAVTSVVLILVSFFGVFHSFGMIMDEYSMMIGCPLMGEAVICTMTIFEHLSIWQKIFAAVPQQKAMSLIALIFALYSLVFSFRRYLFSLFREAEVAFHKSVVEQSFTLPLHGDLAFAFSQGILHSKAH